MARRRIRRGTTPKIVGGVAILLFCISALAGVVGYVLYLQGMHGRYDPDTFCPYDGNHDRTAILVDASDPLSPTQVKRVREYLEDLRHRLSLHEWVGLYVLSEANLVLPSPVFALCNPGSAEEANLLYENPERIRRQFADRFQKPMITALAQLTTPSVPQATSPILEMIRSVITDRHYRSSGHRRLIIISDMLQNTREYTHYAGDYGFESFKALAYARDFLNLSMLNVDVEVLYLKRTATETLQTRRHVGFWELYFSAVDADLDRVEPLL